MLVWQKVFCLGCRCIQLATQRIFFFKFDYHKLCMLINCWQQIEKCCVFKWLYIYSSFQFNQSLDFEQCNMVATIISTREVLWLLNVKHCLSMIYLIITNISPSTTKDTHQTNIQNLHFQSLFLFEGISNIYVVKLAYASKLLRGHVYNNLVWNFWNSNSFTINIQILHLEV